MQLIHQGLPTRERESLIKKGVELMATNRAAEEGTDIVQKKVDEEEANNAEIGDQFWIYSGQRLEVERPKEELEKKTNTLRDIIENVREFQTKWIISVTSIQLKHALGREKQPVWSEEFSSVESSSRKFIWIYNKVGKPLVAND